MQGLDQRHLFVAAYGRGPAAELQRLRLETARALLASGLGVAAVAQRCGYRDRRRCTRACKRAWGHPPRAAAAEATPGIGSADAAASSSAFQRGGRGRSPRPALA